MFDHAALHEVHTGPPLKPGVVPLDANPSLQSVDCTTQFDGIVRFAEGELSSTFYVIGRVSDALHER